MSVTWVLNGSSNKYEVSSKEHLLQIMTQGTLYADAGNPPADYWSDDYEQTVDIDLEFDANITPIGASSGDNFNGTYDGGNFSISNWSFDGTFSGGGPNYLGLFGHMNGGMLENIKLAGVWTVSGISSWVGFLAGQALGATLRNIECTFDEGTLIDVNASYVGAFSGETFFANTYGVTVRGFINQVIRTNGNKGGLLGRIRNGNHVGLRNAAVWTNGISGATVGGIVGELGGDSNLTYCMNSMVGDITGTTCGGICGSNQRGAGTDPFNTFVNSMHGNITGTAHAGGIVGHTYCVAGNLGLFDATNYMTGDVVSTSGTSGGLIGLVTQASSNTCTISNSVVAMNGSSDEAVVGLADPGSVATVSTKIDASFGFTYTTATYGSVSDTFTGTTSDLFAALDYVPLAFTDDASNPYEYEMVFGNVGGNSSYSQYTHAVISKGDVTGPLSIDFDLAENTTEYLTYLDTVSNSAFTDASLTILDSSAQVVKDYAGNTLFPLVHWVLDSNSKYEISSPKHLLQLMNNGTLYTDAGSVPPDWTLASFIQTVDIDLEGDSTNIKPIGTETTVGFRGEYDGNGFTISNWVYVDPAYPSVSSDSGEYDSVGLFGSLQSAAVVKNVSMAGVCSISGFRSSAGFLTGVTLQSTSVYNIEIDLSPGSFITNSNDEATVFNIGGVIGSISGAGPFVALTLKGELEILPSTSTSGVNLGGIVGSGISTNFILFRNLARFTSPLNGTRVGGIVGRLRYSNMTKMMNAMTGSMNCITTAGGIAGDARQDSASQVFSEFVSSMKGTINGTYIGAYCGGLLGYLDQDPGGTVHSLFNYMTGDVIQPTNADRAGGLIGRGDSNTNILTSINAMNGNVRMPTVSDPSSGAEANINTSFGLTYEVDRNITTTPITGVTTDPNTGLPIFDLTATDPDGYAHTFEFVFGNLPREFNQLKIETSGEYMNFAELEIMDMNGTNIALSGTASGTGGGNGGPSLGNDGGKEHAFSSDPLVNTVVDMYAPGGPVFWSIDLDRGYTLAEINRVVFYNRSGTVESLRANGATVSFYSADGGDPEQVGVLTSDLIQQLVVTPLPEFLLPTPSVSSIGATVAEVTGATGYRITVTDVASGTTRVVHDNVSTGDFVVRGLVPETSYILRLFANSGSGYELVDTENVTTLSNSPSNYDKAIYASNGTFDLSGLDDSSFALLSEVINDVFSTGDTLEVKIGTLNSKVSFVRRGEATSTDDSILVPFDSASGSGQQITMQLSDASTVSVSYDESVNALDVGGATVQVGSSIVIDGKKLTVKDV